MYLEDEGIFKFSEEEKELLVEIKYDEKGRIIYTKNKEDIEGWVEYDDSINKIIFTKYSDGFSWNRVYDNNGNEIYYQDSYGCEVHTNYDKDNNKIKVISNDGNLVEYNKNGIMVYFEDINEEKEGWSEYDKDGKIYKQFRFKESFSSDLIEEEICLTYDENGNLIEIEESDGYKCTIEYDDNHMVIHKFVNGEPVK